MVELPPTCTMPQSNPITVWLAAGHCTLVSTCLSNCFSTKASICAQHALLCTFSTDRWVWVTSYSALRHWNLYIPHDVRSMQDTRSWTP